MHPFQVLFLQLSQRYRTVALGLFLALAAPAHAAVYYVDYLSGADTNTGTSPLAPWKRCPGDPTATANVAAANLVAGDTVIFKGGVTYVLAGSTGIILRWNGASGAPINYDGNSGGQWGAGPAIISDLHGNNALAAFSVAGPAAHLVFRNFTFSAIGGHATLPADAGLPVASRFGAGLAFPGGATGVRIEGCVFQNIGYTFNQKPMNAASIAGTGIALGNIDGVTISNSTFSRVATGIEVATAATVSQLNLVNCRFGDAIVWSVNAPPGVAPTLQGCTENASSSFARGSWSGYGESPRTAVRSINAGASVTLTASALASPAATYQWRKNGVVLAGATAPTLTLAAVTQNDAAVYSVLATNPGGSALSHDAVLSVIEAPTTPTTPTSPTTVAPAITAHPASQTVAAGTAVSFSGAASGSPTPTYQWLKNGAALSGATNATLSFASVSSSHAGSYVLVATNDAGAASSNAATLTVTVPAAPTPAPTVPVITTQPVGVTVAGKSTVTFTVVATGQPAPSFQWHKDGAVRAGATDASLTLRNVNKSDNGSYTVVVTNSAGSVISQPAALVVETGTPKRALAGETADVTTSPSAQLVNLSVRSGTGDSADALIVGFVVAGDEDKTVLVRGVGPSLAEFGVTPVRDPKLSLYTGGALLESNDNWSDGPAEIGTAGTRVGAFPLPPASADAALLTVLRAGTYTARVAALAEDATGSALIELYDASPTTSGRLVNVSARTRLRAAGESLVVGFVVAGTEPKSLLIRAVGPGLQPFGVAGVLTDPQLQVFADGVAYQQNDDWAGNVDLADAFAQAGAFGLAAPDSRDAAMIVHAAPGTYTAVVTSGDRTDGVVLVEVYELPTPVTTAQP